MEDKYIYMEWLRWNCGIFKLMTYLLRAEVMSSMVSMFLWSFLGQRLCSSFCNTAGHHWQYLRWNSGHLERWWIWGSTASLVQGVVSHCSFSCTRMFTRGLLNTSRFMSLLATLGSMWSLLDATQPWHGGRYSRGKERKVGSHCSSPSHPTVPEGLVLFFWKIWGSK